MFQTEILEFRVILGPEKISEAREGNWGIIYYLYHFHGGRGRIIGGLGHGPSGPLQLPPYQWL